MLPYKKMTRSELITGFPEDDPVILEIAPTMKSIIHDGRRYHRVDGSYRVLDDGNQAGLYLWDEWGRERMRRLRAEGKVSSDEI